MIKEIRSSNKLEVGLLCWILLINLFRGVLWHAMYVAHVNLQIVFVLWLRSLLYSSRSTIALIVRIDVKGCLTYIENNAKRDRKIYKLRRILIKNEKTVIFDHHAICHSNFGRKACMCSKSSKLSDLNEMLDQQD